ncbi:MAG: 3-isopropylmalate dehydratase large subunit [Calditrichaeota bacterium]|nr:3-isopropylmalate dehydratase large subunit [Calditrichota bacterium]MCB0298921.1 3-isopropylmalate dehydratase large subunit [Calditrichota bacterium]MCB9070274.1 3-isopropylmalate dehydratase large subunit [Calditrichia bacterium]
MGMNITEKILAKAAGYGRVEAGENVWVNVDVLMTHDVCGPPTIGIFKREFGANAKVWDRDKLVIIPDHYIFTEDKHANRNIDILRDFAKEQDLPHFYDVGTSRYKGVCHIALPEEGWTRPGEVLFGTDSHTCTAGAFGQFATGIGNTDAAFILGTGKLWVKVPETMRFEIDGEIPRYVMAKDIILNIIGDIGVDGASYRTMEFAGSAIEAMTMEDRMTLCNMVIEAGGKNGVIAADAKTEAYVQQRTTKTYEIFHNDPDAKFHSVRRYRAEDLKPMIAKPHSPDNKTTIDEVIDTRLDRAYIGSCTGGKFSDFWAAAEILKDHRVGVDTYVVPATIQIAEQLKEATMDGRTLWQIFEDAGAKIGNASCAACLGGPSDTFGRLNNDEVCISTTNRNFPGRMGSKQAQVYLASPYTVAASAITGKITDPREFEVLV